MATIKFFTRSKISNLVPVYIRFTDGRKTDIWIPTPYRLFPDYWNTKTQTFKQRILYTEVFTEAEAKDIEDKFTQLKDFILREHYKLTGPASKEWLKSVIDKFYYKQAPGKENLNEYIDRFIQEATSGQRLCFSGNTKKIYSAGTLRSLKGFQRSFDLYQTERDKKLNFDDITIDFYNDFLAFFYDRNCGANYIGKHIKSLKTIIRQAREEGLHSNNEIDRKAFKAISEEVDNIYLTEAEIKALFELDLSDKKHIEVARDVFLVGCYTAQRYSDYRRITKDNIRTYSGNKVIELIQQKTGEKCIIPIRPELDTILKKYNYTLPKTWEQKINDRIKDVGKLAKITEEINYEQNRGGFAVKKKAFKCDLIKTHTARRSGCTNMYLAGIPIIDIMKISGHKTEREFLKYIKVTKEQTAVNLTSHPYFIGNTLSVEK